LSPAVDSTRSFYDGHGHPFLSFSGLRGGSAVPERNDGAGRSARNRPAHHPLWNGARRASTLLVQNSGRRAAVAVKQPRDLKSGRDPGASEITKDQPVGGGPSRKLNNIIGVRRQPFSFASETAVAPVIGGTQDTALSASQNGTTTSSPEAVARNGK
jgi:hypothetical protein